MVIQATYQCDYPTCRERIHIPDCGDFVGTGWVQHMPEGRHLCQHHSYVSAFDLEYLIVAELSEQ